MELTLIFVAVIVVGITVLFIIQRRRLRISPKDLALMSRELRSVQEKIAHEPKQALIEADKLLDFALKRKGYQGSLGDKLRAAEKLFSSIDAVWEAHKLRNRAAHEVGFVLTENQARSAVSSIKKGLVDLGIRI